MNTKQKSIKANEFIPPSIDVSRIASTFGAVVPWWSCEDVTDGSLVSFNWLVCWIGVGGLDPVELEKKNILCFSLSLIRWISCISISDEKIDIYLDDVDLSPHFHRYHHRNHFPLLQYRIICEYITFGQFSSWLFYVFDKHKEYGIQYID